MCVVVGQSAAGRGEGGGAAAAAGPPPSSSSSSRGMAMAVSLFFFGGEASETLHALVGYDARPAGVQLLVFAATLLTIYACMHAVDRPRPTRQTRPA